MQTEMEHILCVSDNVLIFIVCHVTFELHMNDQGNIQFHGIYSLDDDATARLNATFLTFALVFFYLLFATFSDPFTLFTVRFMSMPMKNSSVVSSLMKIVQRYSLQAHVLYTQTVDIQIDLTVKIDYTYCEL